jgi:hypothetical protein
VLAQEPLELRGDVVAGRVLQGRLVVVGAHRLRGFLQPAHVRGEVPVLLDRLGHLSLEHAGGELDLARVDLQTREVAERLEERERDLRVPRLRQVVRGGRPQR